MTAPGQPAGGRDLSRRTRRTVAGPDPVPEGIAVAGPEGDVEAVDRAFASRFGYDREQLVGAPWRDLLADGEVERLESTAIPAAEDGWRWVGSCVGRRSDGERIAVRVRIAGIDDGSLTFAVRDQNDPSGRR